VQIILVSRHLKAARTFTIMPWHVVATLLVFLALVFSTSALFSWLSVHLRLPLIEDLLVKLQLQESQKTRNYLDNNLQLMATRLGELQGQVLQLDALGDRVSGLAGIKREASLGIVKPSQGGPYLPAPTSPNAMQSEIDRWPATWSATATIWSISNSSCSRSGSRIVCCRRCCRSRMRRWVRPSVPGRPDRRPALDARRLDFSAETGTPVVAAADGVVLSATITRNTAT